MSISHFFSCSLLLVLSASCGDASSPVAAGDDPSGSEEAGSQRPSSSSDAGGRALGDARSARAGDASTADQDPDSTSDGSSPSSSGACEPGSSSTTWASGCQTTPNAACTAGTWTDPGSTTNDPLVCQSAHFAVHAPAGTITAQQCNDATNTLETVVWSTYFGSPMFLAEPYCQSAKKYKASIVVHTDSGLTGGGWGQGYMGMWIGPGATADHWGLAHEFMHAVQSQTKGLACNTQNTCGWIYESHANYAAHQLPEYRTNVHCSEMLPNTPHLYLGSTRDRYCNWQFMEYLKDKYCHQAVNDIWNAPKTGDDPFTNIATTRGWTTDQLNDFFGEWAMHNVTWDYQDPAPTSGDQGPVFRSTYGSVTDQSKPERNLRLTRLDTLDAAQRQYVVPTQQAPQRWGYNLVRIYPDADATEVTVTFRGVVQSAAKSDFRWGLVATDKDITTPRYSPLQHGTDGALTFCVTAGEPLFLMVMATPSVQQQVIWDQLYPSVYRYPYMVQLTGAQPDGFQPSAPNPSANGKRWSNGGGWVANEAHVADGAFVGPLAAVLSGTVGATARIEDHALIVGGTVTSGTVGGLTILLPGFTVSGSAKIDLAWPYGPTFFEKPQSISGSAHLLGDIEFRGANQGESSGSYCGFVDNTIHDNCGGADVTTPPPYAWRP